MGDMFYPGQKDYIAKLNWLATQYANISMTVNVAAPLTSTGGANPVIGISPATADAAGSMSAADKAKLDGVAAAAAAVGNVVAKALGSAVAGVSTSAARADHVHPMPAAADVGAVATSAVGAANGVAPLDASGKVAASYLPSYVDDVLEFANLAAFPASGEGGKIYVADDTNLAYRWSGKGYVEISPSPGSTDAVPEGAKNQYFTAERARAAVTSVAGNAGTASQLATARAISATGDATGTVSFDGSSDVEIELTLAPSGVTAGKYGSPSTVPVITVDAEGRVTSISTTAVSGGTGGGGSVSVDVAAPLTSTGGDNPVLGIDPATEDAPGSMSAADKAKLDGIAAGAAAVSGNVAKSLGAASAGASLSAARDDHVHPMPLAADVGAVAASAVGAANGVAPLDSTGKVAAAYLPSYVDDVLEYANLAAFPATGESGKICVADDTGKIYRWSGSAYIEISASPGSTDAVPEGATNQYFTVSRVLGSILTGFSTASIAAVAATDSILTAIGKLQAQITGKAAKGANSDITSLAGLTSALSITQGGTGATTAAGALAALGGAAVGSVVGAANGPASAGSATTAARSDHVHPLQTSVSGNAGTATKLAAAVTINGVNFDGSENITVADSTKVATNIVGVANGVASLGADGLVPTSQLPAMSGAQTGDILYTGRNPGSGYLAADGTVYAQSAYPALYSVLGILPQAGGFSAGISGATPSAVSGGVTMVAFCNNLFFANGNTSTLCVSADATTWSTVSIGFRVQDVTYGNGLYVAVGSGGKISTSPDGTTWTSRTTPGSLSLTGISYGNGVFVAAAQSSANVYVSSNGTTWTQYSIGSYNSGGGICFGNGLFAVVCNSGAVCTSPDGITWTTQTTGLSTSLATIAYGNSLFMAGGSNGIVITSPDGATWTSRSSTSTGLKTSTTITKVSFGNGMFVVCYSAYLYTTVDGTAWTSRTPGAGGANLVAICYGNARYLVGTDATASYMKYFAVSYATATQFMVPALTPNPGAIPYIKT